MRLTAIALCLIAAPAAALQPADGAMERHEVILDFESGEILHCVRCEELMPPASMSKIMTAMMVFEALDDGRLSLEDEVQVSIEAWRRGGAASGSSTMFLDPNSYATVSDLLHGVVVQSGNDACIALAERLHGSEEAFSAAMTARTRAILAGWNNRTLMNQGGPDETPPWPNFINSTGWPDAYESDEAVMEAVRSGIHDYHRVSAADLARLSAHLIRAHEDHYRRYYPLREFTYNGIRQYNRNPLLGTFTGADGLKTGHTQLSGYGLVASAERDGQRRIIAFNGTSSERERANTAERLMSVAFREYAAYRLYGEGETVGEAEMFMGRAGTVALVAPRDITVGMSRTARRGMRVYVEYDGAVAAPVTAGDEVARLIVEAPDGFRRTYPLHAATSVERKGVFGRAMEAVARSFRG